MSTYSGIVDPALNVTPGEAEGLEMVRIFYTQLWGDGCIHISYPETQSGLFESIPQRVANLDATHVVVMGGRKSGRYLSAELSTYTRNPETSGRRRISIPELIKEVIHQYYEWVDTADRPFPRCLMKWELVFPEGGSSGVMRATREVSKIEGPFTTLVVQMDDHGYRSIS